MSALPSLVTHSRLSQLWEVASDLLIATAQNKFDAEGKLTDQPTRDAISGLLKALPAWARRFPKA